MLNESGNLDDASQMQAFYLLTGFGLEVALKSHLRFLGIPDFPDLKRLGHDLIAAADAVSERIGDDDRLPANLLGVVGRLGPAHNELLMRYTPDNADLTLPHPLLVMEVLDELVDGMALRLLAAA